MAIAKQAIYLGVTAKLRLEAPFVDKTKKILFMRAYVWAFLMELTWSCYEGKDEPCHKCGTCLDREVAFATNGVVDPLVGKGASIMRVNFSNQKLVFSALCIAFIYCSYDLYSNFCFRTIPNSYSNCFI